MRREADIFFSALLFVSMPRDVIEDLALCSCLNWLYFTTLARLAYRIHMFPAHFYCLLTFLFVKRDTSCAHGIAKISLEIACCTLH